MLAAARGDPMSAFMLLRSSRHRRASARACRVVAACAALAMVSAPSCVAEIEAYSLEAEGTKSSRQPRIVVKANGRRLVEINDGNAGVA